MFNKFNTKSLILLFVGLLAIVFIVKIADRKKGDRSFRSNVLEIDTAKISAITVYRKASTDQPVLLTRNNNKWQVKIEDKKFSADQGVISNVLSELHNLTPERMAGANKESWKRYEVTDSLSTKVKIELTRGKSKELFIGKFSYQQPKNQNPYNYYGQQQGTMTTYVRVNGEDKVFAVSGFLSMTFNRNANEFRNKTVLNSNKDDWTRLTFTYPDSSFTLIKEENKWTVNGLIADSASTESYMNSIRNLTSSAFVDDEMPTSTTPTYELKIEGNNFAAPITIKALPAADTVNQHLIMSSLNEDIYFSGNKAGLTEKIFVGKSKFMKNSE